MEKKRGGSQQMGTRAFNVSIVNNNEKLTLAAAFLRELRFSATFLAVLHFFKSR
jgi:hypothetical protein